MFEPFPPRARDTFCGSDGTPYTQESPISPSSTAILASTAGEARTCCEKLSKVEATMAALGNASFAMDCQSAAYCFASNGPALSPFQLYTSAWSRPSTKHCLWCVMGREP